MKFETALLRGMVAAAIITLALSSTVWAGGAARTTIAFVGTDSNIYCCKGDCSVTQCLTCPVSGLEVRAAGLLNVALPVAEQEPVDYNWPTFSPDGTKLAYVSARRGRDGPVFGVHIFDFNVKNSIEIFEGSRERPIYLFWPGDSHKLSFLTAGASGLSLMLAEAREGAPLRLVTRGVPLYFDWNLPRHKLAVHTNSSPAARTEQVYLMSLSESGQTIDKLLSEGMAPFKVPAWSRDSKHLAYVATSAGQAKLYVGDGEGNNPRPLVSLAEGETSFVWAPDSRHVAYSTAPIGENLTYNGIGLVDIATGKTTKLVREPVTAYSFSPDSRHLAYIAVPPGPYFSWKVADLPSGKSRHLADFITTADEAIAYRYFDQLALSHSIWSPRSDALIFAGVLVRGGEAMLPMFSPPPSVWVIPISNAPARKIADGKLGFWSPVGGN